MTHTPICEHCSTACLLLALSVVAGCYSADDDFARTVDATEIDDERYRPETIIEDLCLGAPIGRVPAGESFTGDCCSFDQDEVCDGFEAQFEVNGTFCDTTDDCDGDGLLDNEEWLNRENGFETDPTKADTDDDGLFDEEDPTPLGETTDCSNDIPWEIYPDRPLCRRPVYAETTPFAGRTISQITSIRLRPFDCCYANLDGDPFVDNSFANALYPMMNILSILANSREIEVDEGELIDGIVNRTEEAFADGKLHYALELADSPEELLLGVSHSTRLLQFRGERAVSLLAGEAGSELADATIDVTIQNGELYERLPRSGTLIVPIAVPKIGVNGNVDYEILELEVTNVRAYGTLADPNAAEQGGLRRSFDLADTVLRLGATIPQDEMIRYLNEAFAEIGGARTGIEFAVGRTQGSDEPSIVCSTDEPAFEDWVDVFCTLISSPFNYADVDTNDDGENDGVSIGVQVLIEPIEIGFGE